VLGSKYGKSARTFLLNSVADSAEANDLITWASFYWVNEVNIIYNQKLI
jgi:hypothetical protein